MPQGSISLTGADSLTINGRIFNDLADADAAVIEYDEDLAVVKNGKNGNAIYAKNENGRRANVTVRVLLGSSDDKFLTSLLQLAQNDFSAQTLMTAMFSKRVGDGAGNVSTKIYAGTGGTFRKIPGARTSSEGDTNQSVAEWMLVFADVSPAIQ